MLVQGAWADASSWNGVTESLLAAGHDVRAIANPVENLTTDAEYVANFLNSLTGPIVLVGHSYGGSVITNAAAGNRQVKALVYVDAAAPDVGETNGSLSGADSVLSRKPPSELFHKRPYPGAPPGASDLYLQKDIFIQGFANDLPRDVAARLWASQRTASTEVFETPSQHAAWKTIPRIPMQSPRSSAQRSALCTDTAVHALTCANAPIHTLKRNSTTSPSAMT